MKVRFAVTRVVQDKDSGTARQTSFEAGQVYDLPEASARRWIARGAAEAVAETQVDTPAEVRQQAAPGRQRQRGASRPRTMS